MDTRRPVVRGSRPRSGHPRPASVLRGKDGTVPAADNELTMVVGQGARLEGSIISAGSLRIEGQVKGQITAEGDVIVAPDGQVDADIKAVSVVIAGRFKGSVVAKSRIEIQKGGRLEGNINTKALVIEEGATFQGQSIMEAPQATAPANGNGNGHAAQLAGQGAGKGN